MLLLIIMEFGAQSPETTIDFIFKVIRQLGYLRSNNLYIKVKPELTEEVICSYEPLEVKKLPRTYILIRSRREQAHHVLGVNRRKNNAIKYFRGGGVLGSSLASLERREVRFELKSCYSRAGVFSRNFLLGVFMYSEFLSHLKRLTRKPPLVHVENKNGIVHNPVFVWHTYYLLRG